MHPSHVELIVAIADAGSLGAAAKRIGKTQPAVTKALKRAEEDVGVQLFHRGAHGAHMTLDGARVVERCRRILRDLDALDEDLAQRRGELTGQIGVVVSPFAAMKIIPPVMARFASRFRGVRVQIRGGHAPKAFAALHSAEADFVIGPGPASGGEPGLIAEPLLQTGLALLTGGTSRYALTTDPQILGEAPGRRSVRAGAAPTTRISSKPTGSQQGSRSFCRTPSCPSCRCLKVPILSAASSRSWRPRSCRAGTL